jgi:TonB-linked SusC/RagA family outer membrane protein
MKNNFINTFLFKKRRLLQNIMKTILFLCFTTVFSFTHISVNAQDAKIKITENKTVSVSEIFELIQLQANYRFVYSDELIDKAPKVALNKGIILASELLRRGLSPIGCTYEFTKNKTVIVKKSSKELSIVKQQITIAGVINDIDGEVLPGASILEKGTLNGVLSNFDGDFSIKVANNQAILVISFLGYLQQEIKLNGKTSIKVVLEEDTKILDEVVVIGYGTILKKNITGAVGKVNAALIKDLPALSFQDKLAGKLAGVNILQTTGTPGGNVSIKIRGTSSISASNEPLIVIDGFPLSDGHSSASTQGARPGSSTRQENPQNSLSSINPNDIESVEILKDAAAAAAIYGSRGGNGVILITTKKGIEGKPSFIFNVSSGLQKVTKTYDMMDAYEFAEQNYISRRNGGTLGNYKDEWLPYLNDEPGLTNTNWQDALYREAFMENYDLSVRGGSKNIKYYVSGNHVNQDGVIIGTGYKRYALRTKLDANLSKKVRFGVNVSPSLVISDLVPTENPYFVDGVVNLALLSLPTESIYNADGSYNYTQNTASGSGPFVNPIAIANLVDDQLIHTRFLTGTYLEIDFLKDVTFRTQLGADFNNWNRKYYRPSTLPIRNTLGPSNPSARNFSTQTYNWITENTLTFDKTFNNSHHVNGLLGFTAQKDRRERNQIYGTDFPNDLVQTLNKAETTTARSDISEWSLISYLSRVMYDFEGKYLITASFRADGSSRFGDNTKWGYFPSISAGWRVSDMDFFKSETVNDFKLRVSYGETGNFQIPNYAHIALLGSSEYVFDDTKTSGAAPSTSPNADLTWERNKAINLGLDLSLFNNKLVFNADYYRSTTKDLLINLPVPASSGFSSSFQNIGEIENKGFEFSATNNMTVGDFKIVTNANIATNKNKVLSTGRSDEPIISSGGVSRTHITQVGEPVGSYYGLNVLGVFTTQEQLDTNPHEADAALGDFMFEDINNDAVINADDRTITGSYFPDYTFGISSTVSYKGLDFNIAVQGKQNFQVLHLAQRYLGSLQTFSNYRADIYNNAYISPSNPGNGQVYRPNSSPTNSNDAISSYHIEDASYVRIQNITLGYSFNKNFLKKNWKYTAI